MQNNISFKNTALQDLHFIIFVILTLQETQKQKRQNHNRSDTITQKLSTLCLNVCVYITIGIDTDNFYLFCSTNTIHS